MEKFFAVVIPFDPLARPSHPIVIPPDAIEPGVPSHPIWLPPYIDNTLPVPPPVIDNTLPIPPGTPDPGPNPPQPPHPDNTLPGMLPYPDNTLPLPQPPLTIPSPPIALPPDLPEGSVLLVPIAGGEDAEVPEGVHPDSYPCIAWKPGYLPCVVWVPPMAQPKKSKKG